MMFLTVPSSEYICKAYCLIFALASHHRSRFCKLDPRRRPIQFSNTENVASYLNAPMHASNLVTQVHLSLRDTSAILH